MTMEYREFAQLLLQRDGFLILSHIRPDGDTLGSGSALCSALRRMGKTAYVICNPELTERYAPYVEPFPRRRALSRRAWSRWTSPRRTCFRRIFRVR